MTALSLSAANTLPKDGLTGCFVGRVWLPGEGLVRLDGDAVLDITMAGPTAAELLNASDPLARFTAAAGN